MSRRRLDGAGRPAKVPALPAPERPRRRRRRLVPSWVVTLLLFALVFLLGIALGEALHDNPKPGGSQTIVQTLKP